MTTSPVQVSPALNLNAVAESAQKTRQTDKADNGNSFKSVLKNETAARAQSKTENSVSPDQTGNTQEQAQAQSKSDAPTESGNVKQETDKTTADIVDLPNITAEANAGAMAQLLTLASQFAKTDSKPGETATFDAASAQVENAASTAVVSAPALSADASLAALSGKNDTASALPPHVTTDKTAGNIDQEPSQAEASHNTINVEAAANQPVNPIQEKGPQLSLTAEAAASLRQNTEQNVETSPQPVSPAAFDSLHRAAIDKLEAKAGTPVDRIAPEVGTTAWDQAVSQKVVWMASNEQQSASLTLNPPDLGPLQVMVKVSDNQATAHFVSAHPEVRQALETAIPRLREMLGEAGIQLGQAHVGAGSSGDFAAQAGQHQSSQQFAQSGDASYSVQPEVRMPVQTVRQGLVDTFA